MLSGEGDYNTRHAACPVLSGSKWSELHCIICFYASDPVLYKLFISQWPDQWEKANFPLSVGLQNKPGWQWKFSTVMFFYSVVDSHTHTRLTALFPGLPGWAGTRKVKPIWISLKQETVSGSGISWAICKSAPRSRQITMPVLHHSSFLQAGCPSCRPTNSIKALKAYVVDSHHVFYFFKFFCLFVTCTGRASEPILTVSMLYDVFLC